MSLPQINPALPEGLFNEVMNNPWLFEEILRRGDIPNPSFSCTCRIVHEEYRDMMVRYAQNLINRTERSLCLTTDLPPVGTVVDIKQAIKILHIFKEKVVKARANLFDDEQTIFGGISTTTILTTPDLMNKILGLNSDLSVYAWENPDNYIYIQVCDKNRKLVSEAQLTLFTCQDGVYSAPSYTRSFHPTPENYEMPPGWTPRWYPGNYLYMNAIYIYGANKTERLRAAQAMLQIAMQYGQSKGVDGRISLDSVYAYDVLFFKLGMSTGRLTGDEQIQNWMDDGDWHDHGGKTMYTNEHCVSFLRARMNRHPIPFSSEPSPAYRAEKQADAAFVLGLTMMHKLTQELFSPPPKKQECAIQ